jgi:aldose 1-epimerase
VLWQVASASADPLAVSFAYVSPHGEEGFPGTVALRITYTLTNDNEIKVCST